MRLVCFSLPVALIGLPAVAAMRQAARPSAAFDAPPYVAVSNALSPAMRTLPGNLPALEAGSLVGFDVCAGAGTNLLFCARPLSFPVNAASQDFAIAREVLNGVIDVEKASATIFATRGTGVVNLVSGFKPLATARQTATIHTAQAAKELWREDARQTVPSARQIERTPEIVRRDGDVASARVTDRPLTRIEEAAAAPLVGEADTRVIAGSQTGGRLGSLLDADGVRALADSDYIKLLTDQNLIDGVYDAANVLMAPALQVPAEELALIAGMLSRKPTLASLLDRPCSAGFRAQAATNASAPCQAELSLAVLGADACQHGGTVLLSVELKNTGAAPLFDALILNRLPEHTAFSRFLVTDPLQRGFIHVYVPGLSLLAWKVYSPLQPGATFKATVLLKLDEWRVPVKGTRFRSTASSKTPP